MGLGGCRLKDRTGGNELIDPLGLETKFREDRA